MSDIQRRIVTLFEARGANQVRAMLGEMRTGFGQYRRELSDGERALRGYGNQISQVDKQVRALGTTLRYSVAGGAIFGGYASVRNLTQIQEQLGLISAISPTAFSGQSLVGSQLTQFGEQAEDAAMRALTPIVDFNEGLVNLVSTVQNVPQNEVVPILEEIAKTAKLSLTPVDEATKGITGMLVAFDREANLGNIRRFLAEYQKLIFTVPGGAAAGPQIIQQLPQLAAVSRLAAVNPEQMFGLLNTVLRTGGTPATGARGLQYLIQGLAQPPSDTAAKALRVIGVTPEFTQREGGVAALLKVIEEVRRRGVGGNVRGLRAMTPEMLDQLEGIQGPGQLEGLGISGAGAVFAREAIGRIHGVRSLILLAAQEDQMLSDLRAMVALGEDQAAQTRELSEAWKRFSDKSKLREAATAIDQMAVDVAQVFEPVLNLAGGGIVQLRNLVDRNPEIAVGAGGAGLAALMLRRKMGLGGLLRGAGGVMAVRDAASGMGNAELERGASPTNPVWVAVAFSLSGPGAGGFFGRRGTSGGGGAGTTGTIGRGRGGFFSKFGGIFGPVGAAIGLEESGLLDSAREQGGGIMDFRPYPSKKQLRNIFGWTGLLGEGSSDNNKTMNLRAKGEVTVNIDGLPGGRRKATVPLELFTDFTQPAPTTRGKPKTYRGG